MSPTQTAATEVQTRKRSDQNTERQSDRDGAGTAVELSLDRVFDLLRSERRRRALEYLLGNPEGTTLGDLSEHIAAIENDKSVDAITSRERKRVYVGLYQCHLPRLDDAEVLEFDDDRKTVELGPNVDRLEPYLEMDSDGADDDVRSWAPYYLATPLLGGLLLVVQTLLSPLTWLSAVVTDGLLLVFLGLSIAHARSGGGSLRSAIDR